MKNINNIKNIFLCTTEYHLFLSFHIISALYKSSTFENLIVMTTGMRINVCKYDMSTLSNAKMTEVDWYVLRTHFFVTLLLKNQCNNFFYFQSDFPVHRYIVRNFSKKGAKIILVQDGLKPYVPIEHCKIREFLNTTYNNIIEFIKINDYAGVFMPFDYSKYVNDYHINEVWLTNPEAFHQQINEYQSLFEIPKFSQQSIRNLSHFFNYNLRLNFNTNSILYLTQPLDSDECKLEEINFLKEIFSKHPQSKLYVKFHPSKDMDKDLFYKELPNAIFLENINFPAELIIQNMNKAIIISLYSTALLLNNPKCKFYYIYPIFKNCSSFNVLVSNPTDHIDVISKVDEIKFYEA